MLLRFAPFGLLVSGLALLAASASAQGDSLFPGHQVPVDDSPWAVALGDFDGDGKLDAAVTSWSMGTVSLLRGDGRGDFLPSGTLPVGATPAIDRRHRSEPRRPARADCWEYIGASVSVFLNQGNWVFFGPVQTAVGGSCTGVAVGDLNNDGNTDIVTSSYANAAPQPGALTVLLGNGLGGFGSAMTTFPNATFYAVALGDANGDGALDAAVANGFSTLTTMLGNGAGGFGSPHDLPVKATPSGVKSRT